MPKKAAKKKLPVLLDGDIKPRIVKRSGIGTNGQKRKEWEPSAVQLAIYAAIRRGCSYRQVGAEFKLSYVRVCQVCQQIDQYLALIYFDRVKEMRVRQTQHLEHIFSEAMEAWNRSKEIGVTEETVLAEGELAPRKKRKEVHQCGNPAFLGEARAVLADIRKIHAIDKNPKVDEFVPDDSGERVAGKNRAILLQEEIDRLMAKLAAAKSQTVATKKTE